MKVRSRFLLALMASLALHLAVLTAPGWHLATLDDLLQPEAATSLDVNLVAKPQPVPKPNTAPRKSKPRAKAISNAAPEPVRDAEPAAAVEPVATPDVQAPPTEGEAPQVPEAATAPPAAVPPIALPPVARVRYQVTRGEGGFIVGQAVHEWRHWGTSYSVRNVVETTGIAALFRPVQVVQESSGDVVDGMLRPRLFKTEKNGVAGDTATFDWAAGLVQLSGSGQDIPLEGGTQDMLSMLYQLALMSTDTAGISFPVATGKKVEKYEFTIVGLEKVDTRMGERPAMHLRTKGAGGETTEIWLDIDTPHLPVKIRHVDRKGEIFDQVVERIEIEAITEGTR